MLLKWLKCGGIDSIELHALQQASPMTYEELDVELDRLARCMHDEDCERLQKLGFCKYLE